MIGLRLARHGFGDGDGDGAQLGDRRQKLAFSVLGRGRHQSHRLSGLHEHSIGDPPGAGGKDAQPDARKNI